MIKLRDYQQDLVKKVRSRFANGTKRVIVQAPTGSGKTVIFSWIAKQTSLKDKQVLIVSHRIELLFQSGGTIKQFDMQPQLITAKTRNPRDTPISVAMTGTLKNRMKNQAWIDWWNRLDLIIVDECHRSEFNWINDYDYGMFKLGFSATPKRTGKMPQLSEEYDTICYGPDVQELINKNQLMYDKYFGVPVDISGVGKDSKGEYNTSELFQKYNKSTLYSGLIENYLKICPGETAICFCCNIQHCIETTKSLNEAGIGAKFVTSAPNRPQVPKTDKKAAWTLYNRKKAEYDNYIQAYPIYSGGREDIVDAWKAGEFPVLVNAAIFIDGFDHPPTMTIIVNLATTSENKWLQMLGRGSRPSEGKKFFYILDFGENAKRLGYYRQQREYSIHHSASNGMGVPASKECPKCKALVLASCMICKYCGFEFPKSDKEILAELVEHKYAKKSPREIDIKNMTVPEIEEYARQKGYKKPWVWRQIYILYGEDGLKQYAKKSGYHWKWAKTVAERYAPSSNDKSKK